ncbi:MAG: hypothetical protein HIU81_03870 [Acidobacteria bacterium]|nr:hypothetical protein [Acidobacteriota bacterium]
MATYPFDMQLAEDATALGNVAASSSITLYDPADTAKTTPVTITDLNGLPLANPMTTTAQGFIPAFIGPLPQLRWSGGRYSGLLNSYRGLLDQATTAAQDAQEAKAAAKAAQDSAAETAAAAVIATDTGIAKEMGTSGTASNTYLGTNYVRFEDEAGNQILDRKVLIKVSATTGEIIDIVSEV